MSKNNYATQRELIAYITEARSALRMTRRELADALHISPVTMRNVENGAQALGKRPFIELQRMATATGRPLPELSQDAIDYVRNMRDTTGPESRPILPGGDAVKASPIGSASMLDCESEIDAALRLALDKEVMSKAEQSAKLAGVPVIEILKLMLRKK